MSKNNSSQTDVLVDFRVTLTFGKVLMTMSIIFIALYFWKPSRKILDFAVLTLTASAGVTSAFYFAQATKKNLDNEIKYRRVDKSLELISRWTHLTSIYLNNETLKFIKELEAKKDGERIQFINLQFEEKNNLEQSVTSLLDFFEELGVIVHSGLADEDLLYANYDNIIPRYYYLFSTWITQLRNKTTNGKEKGGTYFKYFEMLKDRWETRY